ncbi:transcriptional activator DEMETER-like isoform X2 [Argentina anserina]|uniref:transcriptional activator DEMETER-like isoform X2 n=1 Tax=Argentina anserina TaxID=57926 RepID=UPI002176948E|nr:transcriptional activator DEMETER-like isoform X2 [Potentilla anserina]
MSSRMKFGGDFSVPIEENYRSMPPWVPVTPQKPLPLKHQHIMLEPYGIHLPAANWQQGYGNVQLGDNYYGTSQAFSPVVQFPRNVAFYGVDGGLAPKNGMTNHNAGSYSQYLGSDSSGWNDGSVTQLLPQDNAAAVYVASANRSRSVDMAANAPLTPMLHPPVANQRNSSSSFLPANRSCNNGSYPSSAVMSRPAAVDFPSQFNDSQGHSNVANWLLNNENHSSSANLLSSGYSSTHIDDFMPLRPSYDLNLNCLPETEGDTTSCAPSQLQFTPYRANYLENNQLPSIQTSLTGGSLSKENEKHVNFFTSTRDAAIQNHGGELLQNIVESASAAIPTPYKENNDSEHDGDRGIDQNQTPQQKTPKRRKHRPKVIIEGKPKRTPKPAIEKNAEPKERLTGKRKNPKNAEPKDPRTGKRKYTRKNIQKESSSQVADSTSEATYHNAGIGARSCRRVLNFDQRGEQGKAYRLNQSKMKSSNLIDLESEMLEENQRRETMSHFSPSLSHLRSNFLIHPERQESAALLATRGDTQNNLHVAKTHADSRYESAPMPQHSHAEGISKHSMQAKTDGENHETTKETANQESSGTISKSSHKKQKVDTGFLSIHHTPLEVTADEEGLGKFDRKRANKAVSNGFAAALNHTILTSYIGSSRMKERKINGVNKCTSDGFSESIASAHNLPKQQMPFKSNSCKEISPVLSFSTNSTTEICNQLVSSPPRKSSRRGKGQTQEPKSVTKQTVRSTTLGSALSSTSKMLQEQNFLYDHQQSSAKTLGLPLITVYPSCMDDIIHRFSVLSINGGCNESMEQEQNALVPYKGDGALVPYERSEYIKKRKARPRVELDSETNRVWNLLMGKEGSEGTEGSDKEKEKHWENERRVFQGRVDSFIARMHLVQGDRRFSRWKGSVVDSVIGVFLTQNVSDHLSSSAFMSLAATFPPKSMSDDQSLDKVGTNILVKEPELCIPVPDDATKLPENMTSQPFMAPYESAEHLRDSLTSWTVMNSIEEHSQCLEEELVSSQDSFGSSVTQGPAENISYSVSNSEAEDLTARRQVNRSCWNSAYPPMVKDVVFQDFYHEVQGSPLLDDGSRQSHKQWAQLKSRSNRIDDFDGTCSVSNPINLDSQKMRSSIDPSISNHLHIYQTSGEPEPFGLESFSEESISSWWPSTASKVTMRKDENYKSFRNIELTGTAVNSSMAQNTLWRSQEPATKDSYDAPRLHSTDQQKYSQPRSNEYYQPPCDSHQHEGNGTFHLQKTSIIEPVKDSEQLPEKKNYSMQDVPNVNQLNKKSSIASDSTSTVNNGSVYSSTKEKSSRERSEAETITNISKGRKKKSESDKKNTVDWDNLRRQVLANGCKEERSEDAMDSLDYEALLNANVKEISNAIRERGMNNMLAERIQEFLKRVVKDHGSINLEWLRDVPPDQAKDYLLSIRGLGLKSVECVRLLTLHHLAFPVDTNVGRIAVRLGWVPLQPLPESLQLHLLELYPMLETIQKYLWPRLCKLDQLTLYELHYQMITFGKVFCTKSKPNCIACPMRGECRHFASAFASAGLALPGPQEKSIVSSTSSPVAEKNCTVAGNVMSLPSPQNYPLQKVGAYRSEPIIEEPASPEQDFTNLAHSDIEDLLNEEYHVPDDPDDIPIIKISITQFTDTLQDLMQNNMNLKEGDLSKALVALNPRAASVPTPKLKNISRLRTEHQVYVLPDSHLLLEGMDRREPDDPSPYLLAIWTPGETANSLQPPESSCSSKDRNTLCNEKTCFSCNSIREEKSQIVRGTILVPCRTAMRGSFPLNGTYFQVNEMFADHASSVNPIDVPREWIWNLPRRTVHFGTSATSIFRDLSTEEIQHCFWRGYVCVRGFERSTRAPKPLITRLHFPQSKMTKTRDEQ